MAQAAGARARGHRGVLARRVPLLPHLRAAGCHAGPPLGPHPRAHPAALRQSRRRGARGPEVEPPPRVLQVLPGECRRLPQAQRVQGHALCPLLLPLPHLGPHKVWRAGLVQEVPLQRRRPHDLRPGAPELPQQRRGHRHRCALAGPPLHLRGDHVRRPHHGLLGPPREQHLPWSPRDPGPPHGRQPRARLQVAGLLEAGVRALHKVHRGPLPARGPADVRAPPQRGDRLPHEPGHLHLPDDLRDLRRRRRRRGRGHLQRPAHHHDLHGPAPCKPRHDRYPLQDQGRGLHPLHHRLAPGGGPHEPLAESAPDFHDGA
mmetsp:Transcript_10762/g.34078  ORF Transcript_10762/g.34078 Transcript_10762/m.34078 type:complete len:317 (+) Transcript_10762:1077-2027(+)